MRSENAGQKASVILSGGEREALITEKVAEPESKEWGGRG
jgi:hypothetical protein